MSPALSKSLAVHHVKLSDVLEIRDGIRFEFHPGLPHTEIEYIILSASQSLMCYSALLLVRVGLKTYEYLIYEPCPWQKLSTVAHQLR